MWAPSLIALGNFVASPLVNLQVAYFRNKTRNSNGMARHQIMTQPW